MYFYKVKFRLAKEEKANEINLNEYKGYFEKAYEYFNQAGEKARTYKKILSQNIGATFIEIYFECAAQLTNPTMVFRNYSRFIIETFEDTQDWITGAGNFLKGIESKEVSQSEVPDFDGLDDEVKILSDKEMIKDIIDMCLYSEVETSEEKKNRLRIIEKIKDLILEYRNLKKN